MAIRAGQILHVANKFVVDRIQTGGAGNLNIPQERVFELGNYQSVGIVRDVPDLTFSLDCLDVDTELEALLTGSADPGADTEGTRYDVALSKPIDITSPWKSPYGEFGAVKGVAIPSLTLESVSYRYGLRENAGEAFSFRGDAIYYVPGTPVQDYVTATAGQTDFTFEEGPALPYREGGKTLYALNVMVNGERLTKDDEYTETTTGIALTTGVTAGAKVSIVYGTADVQSYPQTVHQGVSVKPAAIRGKDIDVYFSTEVNGAPVEVRWPDVQSVNVDWRVTLEDDFEFGNARAVARDYTDVPECTGSVELKPRSVDSLFQRISQITGVPTTEIIGPQSSVAGALRVELRNPETGGATGTAAGTVLKTLYVPAARFTVPGYEGRVQQKLTTTVNFESDDGVLEVFKGSRA